MLLHTPKGKTYRDLYPEKVSLIGDDSKWSQRDAKQLQNSRLMNLHNLQVPFLSIASLFRTGTIKVLNANGEYEDRDIYKWEELFEYYKKRRRFIRVTVVQDAEDYETLVKRFGDLFTKVDEVKDNRPEWIKNLPWNRAKAKQRRHFKDFDEIKQHVAMMQDLIVLLKV